MRLRGGGAALVAAVVLVAGLLVLPALLGDDEDTRSGSSAPSAGSLAFDGRVQVAIPGDLPDDRILAARLENRSFREVGLTARKDLRLLDARGREIPHTAVFAESFARDIYPPRYRRELPESDQLRLGVKARIRPGESAPLTMAWRERSRQGRAVRLAYPGGSLDLPVAEP